MHSQRVPTSFIACRRRAFGGTGSRELRRRQSFSRKTARGQSFSLLSDSPGARSSTVSHQPSSYRMSRNLLPQQKRREKLPSTPRISDETPPHLRNRLCTPSLSCLAFVRVVVFLISPECQMRHGRTPPPSAAKRPLRKEIECPAAPLGDKLLPIRPARSPRGGLRHALGFR